MQQRLARGEAAALGELCDRFASLVHNTAHRVLEDQDAADQVTREVFGYVWENPDAFDPRQEGSLRSWIARLTRRQARVPAAAGRRPGTRRAGRRVRGGGGAAGAAGCAGRRWRPAPTTSSRPCPYRCARRWNWPISSAATTGRRRRTSGDGRRGAAPAAAGPPTAGHRAHPPPGRAPPPGGGGGRCERADRRGGPAEGYGGQADGATRIPPPRQPADDRPSPGPPVELPHGVLRSLLGAWALAACSAEETAAVEAHLTECAPCADEALRLRDAVALLHSERDLDLDPLLRSSVLENCLGRRPARIPVPAWAGPYDAETARLDALLRDFGSRSGIAPVRLRWFEDDRPVQRRTSVAAVIAHLLAVDGLVAAALQLDDPLREAPSAACGPAERTEAFWRLDGRPPTREVRGPWREQAHTLVRTVSFAGQGRGGTARRVRRLLAAAAGRLPGPGLRVLDARRGHRGGRRLPVRAAGGCASARHGRAGRRAAAGGPGSAAARGPRGRSAGSRGGGGRRAGPCTWRSRARAAAEWYVALDSPAAAGSPDRVVAQVALDAVEFCRLVAGAGDAGGGGGRPGGGPRGGQGGAVRGGVHEPHLAVRGAGRAASGGCGRRPEEGARGGTGGRRRRVGGGQQGRSACTPPVPWRRRAAAAAALRAGRPAGGRWVEGRAAVTAVGVTAPSVRRGTRVPHRGRRKGRTPPPPCRGGAPRRPRRSGEADRCAPGFSSGSVRLRCCPR